MEELTLKGLGSCGAIPREREREIERGCPAETNAPAGKIKANTNEGCSKGAAEARWRRGGGDVAAR
ncbi:uncharacterized protein DS421_20g694640 [Arachis hypogaea]|nr:uncharacterized protein DS421_20g694640 [Arachis hypogaea]